ncbi:MAG TPA: phosphatidylserine/phosphatidylglycerophosphate/cardiolipin synthase family protein [Candidatus Limnocylindrales bacterium]|nr:phosphatidylserine/phosphatidylglycerophosphate/cardiolipin synthase family protein [Candidatus Limnocylindrales bacterium]
MKGIPGGKKRAALVAAGAGAGAAGGAAAVAVQRRRGSRGPTNAEAVTPAGARDRAAELLALPRIRRRDEAITFAPTTVTSVELILKGERYFPRILADIAAARDHIHMLFYAIRPGAVAESIIEALAERAAAGLEVKVAVDAIGSGVDTTSRRLYRKLREAGAEVVANDGIAIVRGGRIGSRRLHFHAEDALHFDHRKMMVIDGRVAYVGGTGIEDHFADGRFTDVMCRVTGPVVAQIQLAFLTSWVKDGGPKPPDLVGLFHDDVAAELPADAVEGLRVTLMMNVPGTGHHPIREAILEGLDGAAQTIDIVNPYIATSAVIGRFGEAARRGVRVRVVVPEKPRPPLPLAAFQSWYRELLDVGVEIVRHPGMAHAKVYRFDDVLLVGSCNLDHQSLFRNDELDLRFEGSSVAALAEPFFDELVAASTPVEPSSGIARRTWEQLMRRSARLL